MNPINHRNWRLVLTLTMLVIMSVATGNDSDPEIEFLLTSIGSSDCTFTRNGIDHSAEKAESHLRMKYGKARRYIADADDFIDRLASESSWTGIDYSITCPESGKQSSRDWLNEKLADYRSSH